LSFRNRGIKYTFSSNLEYAKYENDTEQQIFINNQIFNFNYNSKFNLYKFGISAQASKRFLEERLLASFGVRTDANTYNENMNNPLNQLSPRISFSFNITNNTLLNAGTGRYFQLPAYTTLGYRNSENILVNEANANYIGVNHFNLGLEQRFTKEILLSVEGFYKDYFQYPIDLTTGSSLANSGADYEVAGDSQVEFSGTGRAVGFEVLNRVNLKKFTVLASYTYVRSEFSNLANELIPSSWDSKHLLTITSTKDFKNNWRAGLKWRFVGGLPYTPYDLETSRNVLAWNAIGQPYLDFSRLNAERFEPFHQLDIRVDKNFFFNKWSLMLYLDIQNAYNFKNKTQDFIVREQNEDGSFKYTDNGLNYILTRVPNESGTALPTVGIMVKF
jgi:hypothetical protein